MVKNRPANAGDACLTPGLERSPGGGNGNPFQYSCLLDSKTTVEIIKLLRSLNAEKKLTIIMVTHDMEQARDADRVIRLVDGQVVESFSTGI